MNRLTCSITFAILALIGCSQSAKRQQASDNAKPYSPAPNGASPTVPPPGTGPDARTPLGPSKVALDEKSPAAAERLVQQFADALQQGRFGEAYDLIANVHPTWKEIEFTREYSVKREIRTAVGAPTALEGAAGSVYITVPLSVWGKEANGEPFRESWTLTLRRVNDVPGSSERQRRWRIEQVNVRPGG